MAVTEVAQNFDGSGVATTEGYWIVKPDGTSTKAQGVTGTPVAVTGGVIGGGSGVATTDGYWIVKDDVTSTKAQGVTGTPVAVTGIYPNVNGGSGVATTEGYWIVKRDGTRLRLKSQLRKSPFYSETYATKVVMNTRFDGGKTPMGNSELEGKFVQGCGILKRVLWTF